MQANKAEAVLVDFCDVPALQHDRSMLEGCMEDFAHTKINLGALLSNKESSINEQ